MTAEGAADIILTGGGLANALIALALRRQRPDLMIKIIERGKRLGGNKTWSFHSTDFAASRVAFLKPLIVRSWDAQEVRFPRYVRKLATGYNSISSERLHQVVCKELGHGAMLGFDAVAITPTQVTLSDGRLLHARCVIDGRGDAPRNDWQAGYQKFFGLEIELEEPCGLDHPIIMDATVEQIDGYRFVYTLPFEAQRILIEDTYYSNSPALDAEVLEARVKAYAASKGWRIAGIARRESGVLPIVHTGDIDRLWAGADSVPRSGVRAFMFQPTTGYSLPDAVRIAERIAALGELEPARVAALVRAASFAAWRERSFFRLLNRLMFVVAEPHERLRVMQRFYGLPEPLIRRFYACDLTFMDKARILTGKPPISFFGALGVVKERP